VRSDPLRLGALACLLAGCAAAPEAEAPREPVIERPARRTGNAWADCYRGFSPGADAEADLARLGAACAAPASLTAVTPIHAGAAQGEGDPPERFSFRARAGRCYRAFAVGAPSVEDLDLAVFSPDGRFAAADGSRDRWPVVPPRGPLCVDRDGVYTIAVAVTAGSGPYSLQIWGTRHAARPVDRDDDE
jgi:hypothetical protein